MDKRFPIPGGGGRQLPRYALEWRVPDEGHPSAYLALTRDAEVVLADDQGRDAMAMRDVAAEYIGARHGDLWLRWTHEGNGWVAVPVAAPAD